jgi:hypothetical protein
VRRLRTRAIFRTMSAKPSSKQSQSHPAAVADAPPPLTSEKERSQGARDGPDSGSARTFRAVLLGVALVYPVVYVAIALLRMSFPFELEWAEGGAVDHVRRIVSGQPLYIEPSLEFTPFTYTPLYFYAAAGFASILGVDFLALRLLSFLASLACLIWIYRIVRHGQQSRIPAVLAACLFAATYRQGGAWFDIARVDSLFLALVLGGIYALRLGAKPWWTGVIAGSLFALAFLTKQTALLIAAPMALALLITDRARFFAFTGTLVVLVGGSTLWLDRLSDGWYRYYVFDLPRYHQVIGQLLRGFWVQDLLGPFAIALVIGSIHFFAPARRERMREWALDLGIAIGMIGAAYLTKIQNGSYDNLMLPAFAAGSIFFGLGLDALLETTPHVTPSTRLRAERFVCFLCIAQFALLAYKPWIQIPNPRDRAAGEQIIASIRRVPGEAWVPSHGYLAVRAGKKHYAHELALLDVLKTRDTPQLRRLLEKIRAAVRERKFAVIVLDHQLWLRDIVEPHYTLVAQMFAADETHLFRPVTGYWTRPDFVWMPKKQTTP